MTLEQWQLLHIIGAGITFILALREMEFVRDRLRPVNIFALGIISISVWPILLLMILARLATKRG